MATAVCKITWNGGSDEIDLLGSTYSLEIGSGRGWFPKITRLSPKSIANAPLYEDVVEEMTVKITSTSGANFRSNIEALMEPFEIANRLDLGEQDDPVFLVVRSANDSGGNQRRAQIIRTPSNSMAAFERLKGDIFISAEEHVSSPENFTVSVKLKFVRRGQWLDPTDDEVQDDQYGAADLNVGNIITFAADNFANANTNGMRHPCDVELYSYRAAANWNDRSNGYLILHSFPNNTYPVNDGGATVDSTLLSNGVGFSTTAEATTMSGNVYESSNPTSGSEQLLYSNHADHSRPFHVFIKYRNNSSTINWTGTIYQEVWIEPPSTPYGTIPIKNFYLAPTSGPEVMYLGMISLNPYRVRTNYGFGFTPDGTGGSGDRLEVSTILLVPDLPDLFMIALEEFGVEENTGPVGGEEYLKFYHRLDEGRHSRFGNTTGDAYDVPPIVSGNYMAAFLNDELEGIVFDVGSGTNWTTGDGGTNTEVGLKVTRNEGFWTI